MESGGDKLLGSEQIEQISRIQAALLELPKDAGHHKVRSICKAIAELIGSEHAFACYFFDGTINFIEYNIGPQISDHIIATFKGVDAHGDFIMSDPFMEESNRAARQIGTAVINYEEVDKFMQSDFKDTDTFRNVWQPAGMNNLVAIQCRLPIGYVIMCFSYGDDQLDAYRDPANAQILQLILPAFVSAFQKLYEMGAEYVRYETAVFDMPVPAVIVDNRGQPVFSNRLASALVEDDPDRAAAKIDKAYRLPGPLLPNGSASSILMMFQEQPSKTAIFELAEGMKLTPRQAETAFYLTRGYTDRQIAASMEISLSTARRHVEAVLDRLAISSRSGVLFVLLSGRILADNDLSLDRSDRALADRLLETTRDEWPTQIMHDPQTSAQGS